MATLDEIQDNLVQCAEYNKIGTLQATIRYCNDLRLSTLALVQHVRALENALEAAATRKQLPPGGTT